MYQAIFCNYFEAKAKGISSKPFSCHALYLSLRGTKQSKTQLFLIAMKGCRFCQGYELTICIFALLIFNTLFVTQNKKIQLQDLGNRDYKEIWDYQEALFKGVVDVKIANRREGANQETPNYFLFVEHPHVYTLGKSGDLSNLLLSEKQLEAKGATFYKINRGGDITYHGPGQIVGYPIFDLENFFTDIHKYLRFLEEAIILTLAEYGVIGTRSEGETGVWLGVGTPFARKICAMGVRASRWVTMHGFALNVNADLGYFDNIIPCGIKGKAVTSMHAELNRQIDETEVKIKIIKHLSFLFEAEFVDLQVKA